MKLTAFTLKLRGDVLRLRGDIELAPLMTIVNQFLSASSQDVASQVEVITGELRQSNDDLESSTTAHSGT